MPDHLPGDILAGPLTFSKLSLKVNVVIVFSLNHKNPEKNIYTYWVIPKSM